MTGPTPSRLAQKAAAAANPAPAAAPVSAPSRLANRLANGRRGELVELPGLGRAWLEIPGAVRWAELEAAARKAVAELELKLEDGFPYAAAYEVQLATRVLAEAAREDDPAKREIRIGTEAEWGALDNDVINAAWHVFGDVRERLDPMSTPLSEADMIAIGAAAKKKDPALLRSYGVAKLSAWLATTADPPSTSPTPSSPSSDS